MPAIILQIVCALTLTVVAVLLQVSFHREGLRDWEDIMSRINTCDSRLLALSHHPLFSADLECTPEQVWSVIGGVEGLLGMFRNAGVLLAAIEFMENECQSSQRFGRIARHLRANALRVRLLVAGELIGQAFARLLCIPMRNAERAAESYVRLVAEMSLAINDHRPDLFPQYRHFMLSN
jgi:hypothetical protein